MKTLIIVVLLLLLLGPTTAAAAALSDKLWKRKEPDWIYMHRRCAKRYIELKAVDLMFRSERERETKA
jgi:hypothetical protein